MDRRDLKDWVDRLEKEPSDELALEVWKRFSESGYLSELVSIPNRGYYLVRFIDTKSRSEEGIYYQGEGKNPVIWKSVLEASKEALIEKIEEKKDIDCEFF